VARLQALGARGAERGGACFASPLSSGSCLSLLVVGLSCLDPLRCNDALLGLCKPVSARLTLGLHWGWVGFTFDQHGDVVFNVGGYRMRLSDYFDYSSSTVMSASSLDACSDESPLYLFDQEFVRKVRSFWFPRCCCGSGHRSQQPRAPAQPTYS
jgi:hypothetical protein